MVEHLTFNQTVVGSNPATLTYRSNLKYQKTIPQIPKKSVNIDCFTPFISPLYVPCKQRRSRNEATLSTSISAYD